METVIKFGILYFLNSIAFIAQDFTQKSISMKPRYASQPTIGLLIIALITMPINPFLPYLRNLAARRLNNKYIIRFIFQAFYTVATYYYVLSRFSIGMIVASVLILSILRKVVRDENNER